ncbi:MAG: peptidase and in kexin sedolisin [Gemmatimonadetes bacterium]|nr:peptidase and in kexin sedolisin [Gemmatimonadota bacterium]
MNKRWGALALAGLAMAACRDASAPIRTFEADGLRSRSVTDIPGNYIVTFADDGQSNSDVDDNANKLVRAHSGKLRYTYKSALKGMAVSGLSPAAAAALAADPRVLRIEADQIMTASVVQSPATWGIDRVDQRALPLSNSYTYTTDAANVTVYIVDTGINFGHAEFGGRAVTGSDQITAGGTAADCNGHGTHVAGTVGGITYGLAKGVRLVAVRVLDCNGSGTTSGVIAGVDWVTANRVLPAVANMSLGGGKSATLDAAVARAVAAGVTFAVAAGNSTANACDSSPAGEPSALTVGATDASDAFASFSNYGSCVDINAPGVSITSAWLTNTTNTISGTSMASPHVAGAAALYVAANPAATPAQVASALSSSASTGVITSLPAGTVNSLLYVGDASAPPPPPPPPSPSGSVASFTYTCSNLTCSFNASGSTGATSYSWSFGDNTTGSGVTVKHAFASRKSYTVTLTTAPSGTQSSTSKAITCSKNRCQ